MNIGWIIDWSNDFRIGWNGIFLLGVICINVNRVWIFFIPSYRIFAPNYFNFGIIFALIIFEIFVASKVFTFTFFCAMPRQAPVVDIRVPSDGDKDSEAPLSGPINMWAWDSNGYWWVHSNSVINVPPEINTQFVTTFPAPKGELPMTLYPFINGSTLLVSIHNEIVAQPCTTYREIFRPHSYRQQQEISHPSSVGVYQLIHRR